MLIDGKENNKTEINRREIPMTILPRLLSLFKELGYEIKL
jgi:hypothetical protein